MYIYAKKSTQGGLSGEIAASAALMTAQYHHSFEIETLGLEERLPSTTVLECHLFSLLERE